MRVHEIATTLREEYGTPVSSANVRKYLRFLGCNTKSPSSWIEPIFAGLVVEFIAKGYAPTI